uniref:Uncharacterized protein MANES_17G046400 n=1 Tax=Rhizophora mucronata TaxID=61149 RepID=A0A2P2LRC1_RHIMU
MRNQGAKRILLGPSILTVVEEKLILWKQVMNGLLICPSSSLDLDLLMVLIAGCTMDCIKMNLLR